MTARTHDLAALTLLGLVLLANPLQNVALSTALVAILANQIGAIAPDLDQPTAPFWRQLPEGHFAGKFFGKLLGGHRFLSHSLLGLALFAFLAKLLLQFLHPIMPHVDIGLVWWAFVIGVISHLLMDSFTKEGVPWLLPLPFKFGFPPLKAFRVTTGKKLETLVIFPGLLLLDIWLCAGNYTALVAYLQHHLVR